MSGIRVTTGSRLHELYQLRHRLNHEITLEEARHIDATAGRLRPTETRHPDPETPLPTPGPPPTIDGTPRPRGAGTSRTGPSNARQIMDAHGVTSADVKRWAFERGLIPALNRGPAPLALVQDYADAHRTR